MKKCFFTLSLTVCLGCAACGSNEAVDQNSYIESDSKDTISYEEQVERQNTIEKITRESLSDVSSEWLVSNDEPISVFIINDKVDVSVKVITSQIIPRVADDICQPVIAALTDMGYEQYKIIIQHNSNLSNEDASGASWETKDGVTGLFADNEREKVIFQKGVSIADLYSYYDNFGLEETISAGESTNNASSELSTEGDGENAPETDIAESEPKDLDVDLDTNIEKYIDDFSANLQLEAEYSFVKDCSIVLDDTNIMFLLVVEDNTDPERATNLGDTLVRQFNSYVCSYDSSIAPSDDDYFGGLYETYNAMIGIAETSKTSDPNDWLAYYGIIQGNIKVDLSE